MREFLKDVWMHGGEESRAITPENITGEKGRAAMSASHLGVGRKGSCCVPLESGETITLADIEGPGIIRHIWMTVPDKTAAGSFVMRDLVLRFYWDDEETPSVECPVGDFFCNGFGERAIVNSMSIGVIGGALAVACYLFVGIAMHRKPDNTTRFLDYSVLVPRAVPGLLAGLAFLWVFLFLPMWLDNSLKSGWLSGFAWTDWMRENVIVWLRSLRSTIFSVWLAYTVVWMAYGLRLISSTLLQVGPELEEAARSTGATRGQITRHVTIPLSRYGLIGSWLLMFLIFEREYSTGVYLLSPGTETIGSMLVSLWAAGAIDIVAALSFINILLVVVGLGIALRFGVKLHD